MNEAKFRQLMEGQTASARKVYEVVPAAETWDVSAIKAELFRTGSMMEFAIMHGCLKRLAEVGLISEPVRNSYRRVPVRKTPVSSLKELPDLMTASTPPSKVEADSSPIDVLDGLAKRARNMANDMMALSKEIEAAALDLEELGGQQAAEAAKLRQLQALLRD